MIAIDYERAVTLAREASRVVIAGGPHTGKTTLADRIGHENTIRTDDYTAGPWDGQRGAVVAATLAVEANNFGLRAWLVEGVTVARCLRHGQLLDQGAVLVLYMPAVFGVDGRKPGAVQLGKNVDKWIGGVADGGVDVYRVTP